MEFVILSMCRHIFILDLTKHLTDSIICKSFYKSVRDVFNFLQNQEEEPKKKKKKYHKHFAILLENAPVVYISHCLAHSLTLPSILLSSWPFVGMGKDRRKKREN